MLRSFVFRSLNLHISLVKMPTVSLTRFIFYTIFTPFFFQQRFEITANRVSVFTIGMQLNAFDLELCRSFLRPMRPHKKLTEQPTMLTAETRKKNNRNGICLRLHSDLHMLNHACGPFFLTLFTTESVTFVFFSRSHKQNENKFVSWHFSFIFLLVISSAPAVAADFKLIHSFLFLVVRAILISNNFHK